MSVIFWPNL